MRPILRAESLCLWLCVMALLWGCAGSSGITEYEGVVRGTVNYLRSARLPEGADLVVQLRELAGPGEPPRLIAEQIIESPGRVPVSFELRYDRRKIDSTRRYLLAALVLRDERTLLMSGSAYPVLTGRYPDPVKVLLQPSR
ncbi:MAG: YbaY family lipoprotein [Gammaproteobacteria bacterium]|nr:YbaY family lipoprotein [Gammaproteobacteria bacterium]MDJ0873333.1 YbaY family lipoprotein [Gammaproteobacteria bacterium]